jgi:hypothetical protein
MAYNTQLSHAASNAAANALTALVNSGTIKIYTGAQPANADTAVSTQTLLGSVTLAATAFGSATNGTATAGAITSGTAAATGTAAWFRVCNSGGTGIWDGAIGTSGSNLNLNAVSIQSGATIAISAYTFSILEANTNG